MGIFKCQSGGLDMDLVSRSSTHLYLAGSRTVAGNRVAGNCHCRCRCHRGYGILDIAAV